MNNNKNKGKMKRTTLTRLGILTCTFSLLAATSCSDWNDWNTVQTGDDVTATKTLWENLSENPQLSNFKQIIETAGLGSELSANKYYTMWAPVLTDAQRDSILALDHNAIVNQFVYNHVAEYNHQATGYIKERIHTLNDKAYDFSGENGTYKFNDVEIISRNIPSVNGTLHILKDKSPFLPNAYQNIWMVTGIDSIANYFKKYELTRLDEDKSIPGPMVNGKQTYIDSVMITYNDMTNSIRAKLDSEDSTYTMLLPNNEAYKKMYDKIASLYTYAASLQAQDVENSTSAGVNGSYTALTAPSMDMSYLKDSLIRRQIVNNLAYSHNNKYNAKFFDGIPYPYRGVGEPKDSVYSTYRNLFSEPENLFSEQHTVEKVKLSNGQAVVVDSMMFKSWETFNPERTVRGIQACRTLSGTRSNIRVNYPDSSMVDLTDGTQLSFIRVEPTSSFGKPEVDYYLPNVLSGTYRIYAVIPPADVDLTDTTTVVKPNWLNFTLNYFNPRNSKLTDYPFTNSNFVAGSQLITYNQNTGAEVKTNIANTDFFNDTTKVDTLFLGEFTFPCCYAGIGDYYPNIKVTIPSTFSTLASRGHSAAFDRTLRVCAIILRPVEYDKYLKDEE